MVTNTLIKRQKTLPPKTAGFPLVGSLPALLKDPYGFMLKAHIRYGDIYTLDAGLQKIIICNHPRHLDHIFVKNFTNYTKGKAYDVMRLIIPGGLIVSQDETWRRKRRMMQPHFHRKYLAELTNTMVTSIDEGLTPWYAASILKEPIDLVDSFTNITMNVLVRTMFGEGISQDEIMTLSNDITFAQQYLLLALITKDFPDWLPVPGRNRFKSAMQRTHVLVNHLIKRRQEYLDEGYDLLSMLINMVDSETGEGFDGGELFNHTVEMFVAGHETTAMTLAWTFSFLAQYPDIAQKVRDEVDMVLGDRSPTVEDLKNLSYIYQVVQEAMRLYSVANLFLRNVAEDDEIDGYHIPAGATIAPLAYTIHRHPQVWVNPGQFDPDRFSPERLTKEQKLAWIPFGAGQRMCIGKDFSLMETQFAIAMIMQRYTFSLVPGTVIKPLVGLGVKPAGKIPIILTERTDK